MLHQNHASFPNYGQLHEPQATNKENLSITIQNHLYKKKSITPPNATDDESHSLMEVFKRLDEEQIEGRQATPIFPSFVILPYAIYTTKSADPMTLSA